MKVASRLTYTVFHINFLTISIGRFFPPNFTSTTGIFRSPSHNFLNFQAIFLQRTKHKYRAHVLSLLKLVSFQNMHVWDHKEGLISHKFLDFAFVGIFFLPNQTCIFVTYRGLTTWAQNCWLAPYSFLFLN